MHCVSIHDALPSVCCSGLGAALELDTVMNKELRDKWGGAKITVCEKMAPISTYNPNKGFMYLGNTSSVRQSRDEPAQSAGC